MVRRYKKVIIKDNLSKKDALSIRQRYSKSFSALHFLYIYNRLTDSEFEKQDIAILSRAVNRARMLGSGEHVAYRWKRLLVRRGSFQSYRQIANP